MSDKQATKRRLTGFAGHLRPLNSASDELLHVDLLRFIASYAIVLFHFRPFAQGALAVLMAHCRHFGVVVDLFLVLSGFIISYVYEGRLSTRSDYADFLRRRVARLAPLHWATLLFFVLLGLLAATGRFHANHPSDFDWTCLAPSILAIQAFGVCRGLTFNYVSWSISAEMGMYVIAPLLLWLGRASRYAPLLLSVSATALLAVMSGTSGNPWFDWTWDFGVIRAFPDFALGAALFCFRRDLARLPVPRLFLLAALAGFLVGSLRDWPDALLLLFAWLMAAAAIACDMHGARRDWLSRMGVLGQLTYSMYMLHPVIIALLMTFLGQHLFRLGGTAMNLWLVLVAALVVPVSYLSLELFETPARRWIAGSPRRPVVDAVPAA